MVSSVIDKIISHETGIIPSLKIINVFDSHKKILVLFYNPQLLHRKVKNKERCHGTSFTHIP